jgi:hypothetical protein
MVRRRVILASAAETGLSALTLASRRQKPCAWLANALIRQPAVLSTTANPTDGRFDGDACSVAEEGVHPKV